MTSRPTLPRRSTSPSSRSLPWQAVVAATVLALLAAGAVLVVLGGNDDDGGDDAVATPGFTLVPSDEVATGDALGIEFTDLDGTTGTIDDLLDGRPMVVNFFQSYCPPCIEEMPAFDAVARQLDGSVDFLGLAVQDRPEDAAEIVEETGITYPWRRDVRGEIVAATGSAVMPTTMFVTADGDVTHVEAGAMDEAELLALIEAELGVAS